MNPATRSTSSICAGEGKLSCRVKLIFQPNEEGEDEGAGIMVRTYSDKLDQFICEKIRRICENAAKELGGTAEVDDNLSAYVVYNDPALTETAKKAQAKIVGEENVHEVDAMMGSEDFSYYLT